MKFAVVFACLALLGVIAFSALAEPRSGFGWSSDLLDLDVPEVLDSAPDGALHSLALYRSTDGAPVLFVGWVAFVEHETGEPRLGARVARTQASIVDLEGGAPMRVSGQGYDLVVRPKSGDWRSVTKRSHMAFEFVPRNP